MRLSSLLLLSLLPLSVARALPPLTRQMTTAVLPIRLLYFLVKMIVLQSRIAHNGHGRLLAS